MFTAFLFSILHTDQYFNVLISDYGALVYVILFFVIFLETGFVIMPFLPGDSLLFVAGAFAASGSLSVSLLFIFLAIAAVVGDTVNYLIGKYLGEKFFCKFIHHDYLEKTNAFYAKHGKKTIVLARFAPIVRTFAPFIAGVGQMNYLEFFSYNIIGGIAWVAVFLFAGYFFGNVPFVAKNLTLIILLIIIISFIPPVLEYVKHKRGGEEINNDIGCH